MNGKKMRNTTFIILLFFLGFINIGQAKERPFIWVTQHERESILQKIKEQQWAKSDYNDLIYNLDKTIALHQINPRKYLRGMPFDWGKQKKGETPPFFYTTHIGNGKHPNLDNATNKEMTNFWKLSAFLHTGINCGVAYYLTNDEKYAQCATDILNALIQGLIQLKPSTWTGRGGWLCPDDLLRETREIGENIPIIYDFVAPFIKSGGKPYDIGKKAKVEFPIDQAQQVFRTYAKLVVDHGMINSNHPVLESTCLVYNTLALNDAAERNRYLKYYLTENTPHQDALSKIARQFKNEGDIWPETSQYINGVEDRTTQLMYVLTKYDPSLHLGLKYPNIPMSLSRLDYLIYPNGELIRWGDGHRHYSTPYQGYEVAYQLGKLEGVKKLTDRFGALLGSALAKGLYKRKGIQALLWYEEDFQDKSDSIILPRTDQQLHAGIFLQRNLSKTGNPKDGLMCFVGGASMVHGHASGMNIELYGEGQVLGVNNGRGRYAQDIHENYSRIFASNNTIIVNGSSCGDSSGWATLGINTVKLAAMEPMPTKEAVSPFESFSQTTFLDDKGDKAEAVQERTLALIRTSDITGYYIDIFRSKSKLPNQYHDYLYHNIGDSLSFLNTDLNLRPTPDRYMAHANDPWERNRQFRNPGWHFFKDVYTSGNFNKEVIAQFSITKLKSKPIYMNLYIPACENREYTKVMAPHTFEAPAPYDDLPTPTLVVRKRGEAWSKPFAVVYEPFHGNSNNHVIQSVEKLLQNGQFKGLKIKSKIGSEIFVQYVIDQLDNEVYNDSLLGIEFKGRFAVVTTNEKGKVLNMYMGDGEKLVCRDFLLVSKEGSSGAFLDCTQKNPVLKSNGKVSLMSLCKNN